MTEALQAFSLRGHDLIVFHVLDHTEITFPFEGNTHFMGLEDHPDVITDPRALQEAYVGIFREYLDDVERICSTMGVDYYMTHTEEPLDYKNVDYLIRYISPQGKIWSRKRTGFSGQHQRDLANAIKRARFMALMPYIGGVRS